MIAAWLAATLNEALDIAIVTLVLFVLVRTVRGSRARLAMVAVLAIGLIDLAARQLGLPLTAWLFQGLFLTFAVVLLLTFQDDLRRAFERLAARALGSRPPVPEEPALEAVVRAAFTLAAARRGALVVLPGRDPLDRQLVGGLPLDGALSEPLLLSLFDPHSPGHDGAAVVEGGRVRVFAAHLPLSADFAQLGERGTRHAAALGLCERCDALAIAVSEERGSVSVARSGRLNVVDEPDALRRLLSAFVDEVHPRPERPRSWRRILAAAAEWGIALGLALGLWLLVVVGSEVEERPIRAPVAVANLPAGYQLASASPPEVTVTVSALRRRLFLLKPGDVSVTVDALLAQLGRRSFEIGPASVRLPRGITATAVQPDHVVLDLTQARGR